MSPHQINTALLTLAKAKGFEIPDPGNGMAFVMGERLVAFCKVSPSAGGQTRLLPLNAAAPNSSPEPNMSVLVLRNTTANSVTISDMRGAGAFITLSANKTLLCVRVGDSANEESAWAYVELAPGAGS